MGKRILIMFLLLLLVYPVSGDSPPIIDRPKNMDQPSKNETGIMSTLVLIYSKTRDAVGSAYNEIMYFKEMKHNFDNMKAWFDKAKRRAENIWDKTTEIFNDPQNIFVTLERMEDIFDHIDYAAWAIPYELDKILAQTELTYDDIVSGTKYSAAMFPNTDKVIEYIDRKLGFNYLPSESDTINGIYAKRLREAKEKDGRGFPEEDLVTASKLVAANSMANSAMYKQWAIKTSIRSQNIEKTFKDVKGANGNELAACWYAIDQTNANNKLLMNHLEELKLFQATLGVYLYDISDSRTQELRYKDNLNDVSMFMDKALDKKGN